MKKLLFFLFYISLLSISALTVYLNTPLDKLFLSPSATANTVQRVLGLSAFTLLFIQIMIGSNMERLKKFFGDWIFKFHVFEGLFIYSLVILHGLSFVYFNYVLFHRFDPFYVFIDVCVLCVNKLDHFYNFGRIGFWLITSAVFAALFRGFNYWMRKNWRKFHYLNYVAFLIIGVHAYFIGTDTLRQPFATIYYLGLGAVVFTIFKVFVIKVLHRISPR